MTGTLPGPGAMSPGRRVGFRRLIRRSWFSAAVGVVAVYVFFWIVAGHSGFVSISSTSGWLDDAADLGIVAVPVALLAISGEFDLSVGSVYAASELIVAISRNVYGIPPVLSVLLALLFGLLIGFINGVIVVHSRIPSFIVTLAMQFTLQGLTLGIAYVLAGSTTVSVPPSGWVAKLFAGKVGPFYVSVFWWVLIALVLAWILHRCVWGNWIYAIGGNKVTARDYGVPVNRVKVALYMTTGVCAALIGIMQAFQFSEGDGLAGQSYVFLGLVAAVLGGVLLAGGAGGVLGVCFGALIYGIVDIGIFYTGWNTNYGLTVVGILLLAAAMGNEFFRRVKE